MKFFKLNNLMNTSNNESINNSKIDRFTKITDKLNQLQVYF